MPFVCHPYSEMHNTTDIVEALLACSPLDAMDFEQPQPGRTPAAEDVAAVGFPYHVLCQQPIPPECLSRYSTLSEALGSPRASLEDISLVEEGAVPPAPSDQTCSDMLDDESASLVGGRCPSLCQGTILGEYSALAGALGSPHVQEAALEGILPFEEATLSVAPSDQTCSYMSDNESAGHLEQRYEHVSQYEYHGGGAPRSPDAVVYSVGTLKFLPLGKYLIEGTQCMLDGNSRAFLLTIKTERLSAVARPYGRLQVLPVQHAAQYSQRDH